MTVWRETEEVGLWGAFKAFDVLGLKHGMASRLGGVSEGQLGSLNLGFLAEPESPENVSENRQNFLKQIGLKAENLATYRQVHGDRIVRAHEPINSMVEADAVVTNVPELALLVLAADCVPIVLVDPVRRAIGVAHAGWKGTAMQIAAKTVRRMKIEFGSVPEEMWAGIGPSIGHCCYEVSKDVYLEVMESLDDPQYPEVIPAKPHLDLWAVNEQQLADTGLQRHQILNAKVCTHCKHDRFFSHRAGHRGRGGITAAWPTR